MKDVTKVVVRLCGGGYIKGLVEREQLQDFRNNHIKGLYIKRSGVKDIVIPNQDILFIKEFNN